MAGHALSGSFGQTMASAVQAGRSAVQSLVVYGSAVRRSMPTSTMTPSSAWSACKAGQRTTVTQSGMQQ